MNTNKLKKFALFPFAILLVACGTNPIAATQPIAQSVEQNAPVVQDSPVVENVALQTEINSGQSVAVPSFQAGLTYPIVDTDQTYCYDDQSSISCPAEGQSFYGQDGNYTGSTPQYQDNGNGTVTDLVTGLMWQQDPGEKMTYDQAVAGADSFTLAGYDDWRLPSIKELYSLIQFDGFDPSGPSSANLVPFIDTDYFNFEYGDESAGERVIDSQWATSTKYVSTTMFGSETMFGVNFADGRIKGYGYGAMRGNEKTFFVIYVRGNTSYGINSFADNGNGTITDQATGLTWTQNDSAAGMDWEAALNYCESLETGGSSDWRLPNVKELQSIVDYSRSPDTTNSAAIDPIFNTSSITNEAGQTDYPYFWSSTTHANLQGGGNASYVSFGRALGYMNNQWMDVHGAGAQRSDPKISSAADQYPTGHGPQGDAVRGSNYVRCVTDGTNSNVQVGGVIDNTPVMQEQALVGQAPQGQVPSGGQPSQGQAPQGQTGAPTGQTQPQNDGQRLQIDLASAAAQLGVTEQALQAALGEPGQGRPDLASAAAQLGVSEQAMIAALGLPAGGLPQGGGPQS